MIKHFRKQINMTQKELARQSGVNFRSLQDYEQGRKPLSSANGDVLLRLSTVLGCSVEDLLLNGPFPGAPLHEHNELPLEVILAQHFHSEKYGISGKWISDGSRLAIRFFYDGEAHILPFFAFFSEAKLDNLRWAALWQMENFIDGLELRKSGFESW